MEATQPNDPNKQGYISCQATVFCGLCVVWEYVEGGRSLTAVKKDAKSKGWRFTKENKWICPNHPEIK